MNKAIAYQLQGKPEEAKAVLAEIPPEVLATFMADPNIRQMFE